MTLVSIALQGDKSPAQYAEAARQVEDLGFDGLSVYADLGYQPPLPALLQAAAVTDRLTLMPSCLNPYLSHPVEIAGQHAALDAASGGRARLGLARGSWLDRLALVQTRPVRAMGETARIVRALVSGDRGGVTGEVFHLAPGTGLEYSPLRSEVPITIGTWGPRGAAVAAAVADEVKIGGSANPEMVSLMRRWLDDAGGQHVGIAIGAVSVVDEDGDAARDRARREVAMYVDVVAGLDRATPVDPGLLDQVRDLVAEGDDEAAGAALPDRVLDQFAFAGTPDHLIAAARALIAAGASRIEFGTPHGFDGTAGIELLGTRVLPALRDPAHAERTA